MKYENDTLRHMLAAEYVLGTLRGRARDRFERLLTDDQALWAVLAYWESRLGQLGLNLTPVAPPEAVWRAVERRVGRIPPADRAPVGSKPGSVTGPPLWRRLGFWRGWAGVATAASLALAIALWAVSGAPPKPSQPHYVSVLRTKHGQQRWLVMLYPEQHEMRVKKISSYTVPKHHSLELWMLPGEHAKAVSLGLIQRARNGRAQVTPSAWRRLNKKAKLAVSLEPEGGSPTGQHTGPILSTAQILVVH